MVSALLMKFVWYLLYTAISRKVVGKMCTRQYRIGYYQYTVPDTVAVEPTFIAFLWHLQTFVRRFSYHSFKFL